MTRKVLLLLWLAVMLGLGFCVGVFFDRTTVWKRDKVLFEELGVRPAPLPVSQKERQSTEPIDSGLRFQEARDTGIDFEYENGPDDLFHLADTLGGGVAALDFDNDGHADVAFVNGGNPVVPTSDGPSHVQLYRRHTELKFQPITETANLLWHGYGHGCSVTDINNDGFEDLLITGYQTSAVFINQGDGSFRQSQMLDAFTAGRWCATAAFSDLDHDGDVDAYIACYTDTSATLPTPVCESDGRRVHCNPHHDNGVPDLLIENAGNSQFHDRSVASGIAAFSEYGLGVTIADLNQDGAWEIFVANDGKRNLLFRSIDTWKYEEIAVTSGVAYNGEGETMGAMGIACADFDDNGWLDLLTTNFAFERNALFSNLGNFAFVDGSQGTALDRNSRPSVGWSAITLDADLDGMTDLFIANGHVTDMPAQSWAQLPLLFRGSSDQLQLSRGAGDYFDNSWHGRGACKADFNEDGKDDLIISHIDTQASLLTNTSPNAGKSLSLRLVGIESCRSAEGSIVEIETAAGTTVYRYSRNAGYLSSNSDIMTIGVGNADVIDSVRIHWSGGHVQEFKEVAVNVFLTAVEARRVLIVAPPR